MIQYPPELDAVQIGFELSDAHRAHEVGVVVDGSCGLALPGLMIIGAGSQVCSAHLLQTRCVRRTSHLLRVQLLKHDLSS